jgi:phage gpG-like protein
MPLMLYLGEEVGKASSRINKFIMAGKAVEAYAVLGITAEKVIQDAFDTGGFGYWSKLKYREGSPLILSGQLRKSIHSKVIAV